MSRALRDALGKFVTGVTVITAHHEGCDYGVTVNSFNSVSLDPPLVLWSLARTSSSLEAFKNAEHFAVHVLAADQRDLSDRFAKSGPDKFTDFEFDRAEHGTPLVDGCSARFLCRRAFNYDGGDHEIIVGEVIDYVDSDRAPIAYHAGRYALTMAHDSGKGQPAHLTHLVQSCYFHMLTPVRDERTRLDITLHEHYLLNALRSQGTLSIDEANRIVGYSGLEIDQPVIDSLESRGLIAPSDQEAKSFSLTKVGADSVVRMISASLVMEQKLAEEFSLEERRALHTLLSRIIKLCSVAEQSHVTRHMDLLQCLLGDDGESA
jgi:3-hydroxy-9,10-secoandrosta-1,3,5(10)-triene-9,17-dione monooxygenase reductase component